MNLETFFIKGYVTGSIDKSINLDEFYSYEFFHCEDEDVTWNNPEAEEKIRSLQNIFAEQYVSKIFTEFENKAVCMWAGVDGGSAEWHNDFEDGGAFNSNVLIYMDDLTPENGNKIEVRNSLTQEEIILYPKKRDFVWLNQQRCYQHRATHKTGTRRVISFEYLIPTLL